MIKVDGKTFDHQLGAEGLMDFMGGMTMEEGAMMTTMKSTNVPFSRVGKGDGNCNSNSDCDSDSGLDTFNNRQMLQTAMECMGV